MITKIIKITYYVLSINDFDSEAVFQECKLVYDIFFIFRNKILGTRLKHANIRLLYYFN